MKRFLYMLLLCICLILFYQSAEASSQVVVEEYNHQEDFIDLTYPHFDGMINQDAQEKMNSTIEADINNYIQNLQDRKGIEEERGNFKEGSYGRARYDVHYNDGNVISISIYKNYFFVGDAHNVPYLDTFTFDLKTGDVIPFQKIFKWDNNSRNYVYNAILKQLSGQNYMSQISPASGSFPLSKDYNYVYEKLTKKLSDADYIPNYYLNSKDKCVFVFQKYEIAAGVHSIVQFEVTMPERLENEQSKDLF
jgi:hypothetical protein